MGPSSEPGVERIRYRYPVHLFGSMFENAIKNLSEGAAVKWDRENSKKEELG
jgi:hypothetical protein